MPLLPTMSRADEHELLRVACDLVDDEALRAIASADWEFDDVYAALRDVRVARQFPTTVSGSLHECLMLSTNHTPSRTMTPEASAMQLFACCVLLHVTASQSWQLLGHEGTLGRMIARAVDLGPETCSATTSFVAWLAIHDEDIVPRSFHALAMLYLQIAIQTPMDVGAQLAALELQWQLDATTLAGDILLDVDDDLDEAGLDDVERNIREDKIIWLLCLGDTFEMNPWRILARSLLPADDSPLGRLRQRLDPPTWGPPQPLG